MFRDRADAGRQLGRALEDYRDRDPLVLAIPRGGVEVAYEVAGHLHADLAIVVTRKLPFPDNPEAGFGAIAEDGSTVILPRAVAWLSEEVIQQVARQQQEEIRRRVAVLRGGRPLPDLAGRTVILVDDGIAMGSTMRASIALCRNQNAAHIVAAVPVTSRAVAAQIGELVDDIVVLETPPNFRAVAQVYRYWHDVPDAEVLEIMARWEREQAEVG